MKYIVGAGIGGLFGLGVPLMMEVEDINNDSVRQEEFQPVEDQSPMIIDNAMHLPDEYCGYINYKSDNVKEQAKECLNRSVVAVPAI